MSMFTEAERSLLLPPQLGIMGRHWGLNCMIKTVIQFAFVLPISYYVFHEEDFGAKKFYCVASSPKNNNRLSYVYAGLFATDIACTVVLVFMLRVTRRQIAK